jgi:hypothetical protein
MVEGFETLTVGERAHLDSGGTAPIEKEDPLIEDEADADVADTEEAEVADESDDEAEVETKDEEAKEEKQKKDVGRVPLRKLREEEDRRRALEKEHVQLKEQFARADERLRMLFQAQEQTKNFAQEQTKDLPPDKTQDPLGFMEWQQTQIERLANDQRAQQQSYQQQAQLNAVDTAYKQAWGTFANKTPDALDAYQHFVTVTAGYLEMQGVPQDRINALVENEERKITVAAMQRGVSPAELIYEKAKAFGFQPKPIVTQQQKNDEATQKAEADIERRQKGAAAAKSLSTAGGTRGGQSVTALDLASMSDDEFAEVRAKLGDKAFNKIMGG